MRKEHLIAIGSFALFGSLALVIYWGIVVPALRSQTVPADLRFVQTEERVPPFFENVFRAADFRSSDFLINDPLATVRGHPLLPEHGGLGPHDLLGFRNRCIPTKPLIISIGDSITYGNNAAFDDNWPGVMRSALGLRDLDTYSMAVGGWGAVQYFDMFMKAVLWQPRAIVVVFYTGNDAIESFRDVYRMDAFKSLRPDDTLSINDLPAGSSNDEWVARFEDGVQIAFTPRRRLIANDRGSRVVRAGYEIMKRVAQRADVVAAVHDVKVLLVVVPTKELVFAPRLERGHVDAPPDFKALIKNETANIDELAQAFATLKNVRFLDLRAALQDECLKDIGCYPPDSNGHPWPAGYARLGKAVADEVRPWITPEDIPQSR